MHKKTLKFKFKLLKTEIFGLNVCMNTLVILEDLLHSVEEIMLEVCIQTYKEILSLLVAIRVSMKKLMVVLYLIKVEVIQVNLNLFKL